MLMSYTALSELVQNNTIEKALPENINGTSIDIRLGSTVLVESMPARTCPHCRLIVNGDDAHVTEARAPAVYTCKRCGHRGRYIDFVEAVDISKKQPLEMRTVDCSNGYILAPGEAVLGHSVEVFNLPDDITAEFRLKSSGARCFLEHLHAAWCDPMWQGSVLTLELVNMSRFHPLLLTAGMKIGQMTFYEHIPVPYEKSYAERGQYNGQRTVSQSLGAK